MVCETPDSCNDVNWPTNLCPACQKFIEEAATQSALNFGVSDRFYCGICGRELSQKELINHLNTNPNGECLDANS